MTASKLTKIYESMSNKKNRRDLFSIYGGHVLKQKYKLVYISINKIMCIYIYVVLGA